MSYKVFGPPTVMGDESIMAPKAHGTSAVPVQERLRWGYVLEMMLTVCWIARKRVVTIRIFLTFKFCFPIVPLYSKLDVIAKKQMKFAISIGTMQNTAATMKIQHSRRKQWRPMGQFNFTIQTLGNCYFKHQLEGQ
jgi:hypothetical protein